jgi:hypothetical protein
VISKLNKEIEIFVVFYCYFGLIFIGLLLVDLRFYETWYLVFSLFVDVC